jgi:hypothetical protein
MIIASAPIMSIRLCTVSSARCEVRTGGEITVSSETRDYHVAVDWLTGRVSIDE